MCSRHRRLEQEIQAIQKQTSELPEGKLICVHNGKYIKWFQSDGHTSSYIPRKNQSLAQKLAHKKYLLLKEKELSQEKKAIGLYLHHYSPTSYVQRFFSDYPEFTQLLTEDLLPSSDELQHWMLSPFEQNPKFPEQKIHKTSSGIYVRSKSEAIIAMLLHTHRIPFRYECALTLNQITLYPDFTIRHPQTGDIFYWEHFGMMDDPSYSKKAFSKLSLYAEYGILPNILLLTSFETGKQPLDSELAETMITHFFL